MKKSLAILIMPLFLLNCENSLIKESAPLPPVIKAPMYSTSDRDTIREMIEHTPEGYTLLGDAVSGWNYVYTSN